MHANNNNNYDENLWNKTSFSMTLHVLFTLTGMKKGQDFHYIINMPFCVNSIFSLPDLMSISCNESHCAHLVDLIYANQTSVHIRNDLMIFNFLNICTNNFLIQLFGKSVSLIIHHSIREKDNI